MSLQTIEETDDQIVDIVANPLSQIERASIDCQVSTARKYPRNFASVKNKMRSLATLDDETAASCFYKLNRQGKSIEGPSIRMAEIALSCFGNMRAGSRVIGNDGKTVTAQAFCHDLENNTLIVVETQRRITDKQGKTYSDDMIVTTGNAACSIALRNATFRVVPMALIKPVYLEAKRAAVGDIATLADRRTNAFKYFATLGVSQAQVLATLGKAGVEEVDLSDLETLIGLKTAIQDGSTTVDEAFGPKKPAIQQTPKPSRETSAPAPATPTADEQDRSRPTQPADGTTQEPPEAGPLEILRGKLADSGVHEPDLIRYMYFVRQVTKQNVTSLDQVNEGRIESITKNWETQLKHLREFLAKEVAQ